MTELLVYCTDLVCNHSGTLPIAGLPDDLIIQSLDRRMVCTKCGRIGADVRPHFIYRPSDNRQHADMKCISGFAALFVAALIAQATAEPIERHRIEVSDGDTIRLDGKRLRVIGCDTPETTDDQARCDAEREWGERAKARLISILDSGNIDIERSGRLDRYKRPLVWVFVDGRDVCDILIRERISRALQGARPSDGLVP